jgi:TPR repeat protein
MRTTIIPITIALSFSLLVSGCTKAESKEARVKRVCDKLLKEETAACTDDDCKEEAKAKFESCISLSKTVGASEAGGGGSKGSMEDQVAEKKKLCDGGDQDACSMYGAALMLGKGVEKDEAKGAGVVKKACESGNASGCEMYARAFERGMGVAADPAQFAQYMDKACSLGAGGACRSLALSFDNADAKRIPLLEKACEKKDALGCMGLGAAYLHGNQGTAKDLVKAKTFLQKACDLDPQQASGACQKAQEI